MFGDSLSVLYSTVQRQMESAVGKYSTIFANKMFKAVVSLRKVFGNNLWEILDIILIDLVTAVSLRQCYSALRKHSNIRGLAYLPDVYCCCTIILGFITACTILALLDT
jgi:hypothetical protein